MWREPGMNTWAFLEWLELHQVTKDRDRWQRKHASSKSIVLELCAREMMRMRMRRKNNEARYKMKSKARVCGENILELAGGWRRPPQCRTMHEKTERRNKKQITCQQSTKRWQSEDIHSMASCVLLWVQWVECAVEREELGTDWRQEKWFMV